MNAVEYLNRINKIEAIIKNKTVERQRWVEISRSCGEFSIGERVQSSGNPHKMTDAIATYMDIDKEIDALRKEIKAIFKVIERLPTIEYDIIHKIHVQKLTISDVAELYDKSYSWVTTTKSNAIKHLQTILDANGL